jgi:phenylalanyl-tRNA synthetase beta chain
LAVKDAFYRIAKLLFEISGAKLSGPVKINHLKEIDLKTIELTLTEIEDHLGITILGEDLVSILAPLGFLVKHLTQEATDRFSVTVPSWRPDVTLVVDVIEEVARIYGYNNFPKTLPTGDLPTHQDSFAPDWERLVKEKLAAAGLNEVMGYTLLSEEVIQKAGFDPKATLKILNPNSEDFVYLRPSLLPGNLLAVERSLTDFKEVTLFEIGKVFAESEKSLPQQDRQLSLVSNQGFAHLKGVVGIIAGTLNLEINYSKKDLDLFNEGEAGIVTVGKEIIGQIGNLDKNLLSNFNIETEVSAALFDFEKLIKLGNIEKTYTPLPKFPEVKEDLSVVVDLEIETQTITNLINKSGKPLLKSADPFDQYSGSKLGSGKKSITFSLAFAANKTLTNKEVAKVRSKIIKQLQKVLKAEIR